MQRSPGRHDAISRLKTNLDRIMEETENILKSEKAVGSPSSLNGTEQFGYSFRDKRNEMGDASTETAASKFEVVDVLFKILQKQEELTVEEYTINNSTFKVLVIEDTEL